MNIVASWRCEEYPELKNLLEEVMLGKMFVNFSQVNNQFYFFKNDWEIFEEGDIERRHEMPLEVVKTILSIFDNYEVLARCQKSNNNELMFEGHYKKY